MQCKCGAEIKTQEHQVKTKKGLSSWSDSEFDKNLSPYSIEQKQCVSCGRVASIKVEDCDGNQI